MLLVTHSFTAIRRAANTFLIIRDKKAKGVRGLWGTECLAVFYGLGCVVSELDMGMGFHQQHPPRCIALEHMLHVRFMGCDFYM